MRPRIFFLFPLLVALAVAQQETAAPFTVTIGISQKEFNKGDPIIVDVRLENNSDNAISVPFTNSAPGHAELTYEVDVLDGHGRRAPRTKYGIALRGEDGNGGFFKSTQTKQIKPHDSIADSLEITKIYDLSQPGQYVVQLKKRLGSTPTAWLPSNALKITVN